MSKGAKTLRRMCAAANYLPAGQDRTNRSARQNSEIITLIERSAPERPLGDRRVA